MNCLPRNAILEYNSNQMEEVRQTFGYGDISRLHQDIILFEDWIKMQQHFVIKKFDKEYLERYLISSKGSIERAKKRLDKLCTIRGLMPDYLQGFDIKSEFEKLIKSCQVVVLPKPSPDNYRIIHVAVSKPEAANFEHKNVARCLIILMEYLYCHDYNAGIELILDATQITLGIISKLSPIVIANTMMIITDALGLRLRGIHLISGSKFMETVATIVKQGLSKKLMSRFHVHEDYTTLHKLISKDLLPIDLGGALDTTEVLFGNNFKECLSPEFMRKLKYMEGATTDESKRLRCSFNEEYSGVPGSFKVLSVD